MYIVFGNKDIQGLDEKYLILELDTFNISSEIIPTYCVVDSKFINISSLKIKKLHENLIKNYKIGNWKFCTDAIRHLRGEFSGELDSFYDVLLERVSMLSKTHLPDAWDGVIQR
jgi:hypothetical protein